MRLNETLQADLAPQARTSQAVASRVDGVPPPGSNLFSVASELDVNISQMSRWELVDFIKQADVPLCDDTVARLDYLARPDLERLAFLTRRCCRNQINTFRQARGEAAPFIADL
ncbi:MAG: hypothetical protein DWQ34_21180 [Planctomycetota bacterium]|nr:MAG: hypothetical protein DWQ34_21180 [Planctomycetota bacterium]REJ96005.1 MAG: hypothetical protein DWQ29_01245 [Planctomycetota bacterium]REK20431.1 MAG: hypothetical protein DWQ41_25185 [Planctomycetota bacterium]REK29276.1 MAG: hypothetical protein DWQ45_23175 [Planctomycetota bacterium]